MSSPGESVGATSDWPVFAFKYSCKLEFREFGAMWAYILSSRIAGTVEREHASKKSKQKGKKDSLSTMCNIAEG